MTYERIKEELKKRLNLPFTPEEFILFNDDKELDCGFYAWLRTVERLAKIEALEEMQRCFRQQDRRYAEVHCDIMINELKAGN